jgi:hypothetical protein
MVSSIKILKLILDLKKSELIKKNKLNNYDNDYAGKISLLTIDIYFNNKLQYVKRVYSKIQDVFANIAGIMNFLTVLGKIIVGFYSTFAFEEDLINSVFKRVNVDESNFKKDYNSSLKVNIIDNNNNENRGKLATQKCEKIDTSKLSQKDLINQYAKKLTYNKNSKKSEFIISKEMKSIDNVSDSKR